jgi:hypothetical protein
MSPLREAESNLRDLAAEILVVAQALRRVGMTQIAEELDECAGWTHDIRKLIDQGVEQKLNGDLADARAGHAETLKFVGDVVSGRITIN